MTIVSPSRFVVADIGFAALNRQTVKSLNRKNYVTAPRCVDAFVLTPGHHLEKKTVRLHPTTSGSITILFGIDHASALVIPVPTGQTPPTRLAPRRHALPALTRALARRGGRGDLAGTGRVARLRSSYGPTTAIRHRTLGWTS